jgi:tetratricopeptide (TPR) repeat protein
MFLKRAAVALAAAFVVFSGVSLAQVTTNIQGKVIGEDGQPLKGAVIKIERTDVTAHYQTKTDKKGNYYYGGLALGTFNVCVEVDGKVQDCVNKMRTTLDDNHVDFSLQNTKKQQDAIKTAALNGTLTDEQTKQLTPEARAQLKDQQKQRADMIARKQKLNDSYSAGMAALDCAKKPASCPSTAPADPANPTATPKPMNAQAYYEQAIASFKQAGDADASQPAIWSHLAEAQVGLAGLQTGADQQATLTAATENYQKSIAQKADDPAVHNNYALALARLKKYDEAYAELKKAADLDQPNAGKYYYNLGALLVNAGQYDPALEAFKKAIELTPAYAEAHYQYAVCLSSKMTVTASGQTIAPPEMKPELVKYLELAPNGPNAESAKAMLAAIDTSVATTYVNPNASKKSTKKKQQ